MIYIYIYSHPSPPSVPLMCLLTHLAYVVATMQPQEKLRFIVQVFSTYHWNPIVIFVGPIYYIYIYILSDDIFNQCQVTEVDRSSGAPRNNNHWTAPCDRARGDLPLSFILTTTVVHQAWCNEKMAAVHVCTLGNWHISIAYRLDEFLIDKPT